MDGREGGCWVRLGTKLRGFYWELGALACSGKEEEEELENFRGRREGFGWLPTLDSLTLSDDEKGVEGGGSYGFYQELEE